MTRAARVAARAKINLVLRVDAPDGSGYHPIETLFARLDLADVLTVRVAERGRSIDTLGADVGPPESNLAFRAAVAFAERTGWPRGFAIELEKAIPVGGGLGGGSADAGAVLRALNVLAPSALSGDALLEVAAGLGADVPFLTTEHPLAIGRGRGERLFPVAPLPVAEVSLVAFPFGISTRSAYAWLDESRSGGPGGTRSVAAKQRSPAVAAARGPGLRGSDRGATILDAVAVSSWTRVAAIAANDFEGPVTARHPEIARALADARDGGAAIAQLSGSGSTIFVISRLPGASSEQRALHREAR